MGLAKFVILFIFILGAVSGKNLSFDFEDSVIDSNKEWVRFRIGISGGTKPYTYRYDQYPAQWNPVYSYLYVPKSKLINKMKYPCRIRVNDIRGNTWQGTIILISKNNGITLHPKIYEYNYQFNNTFFNEDGFSGMPELITNKLTVRNQYQSEYLYPDFYNSNREIVEEINSLSRNAGSSTYRLSEIVEQIHESIQVKNTFSLTNLIRAIEQEKKDTNNSKPNTTVSTTQKPEQNNTLSIPSQSINLNNITLQIPPQKLSPNNIIPIPQTLQIPPQKINTTLSIPIDKIFLRLPTQKQLDEIILSADSLAILKTIQNVIRSDLNCTAKVYYLQDFLGRMQSAVEMKNFATEQLAIIIKAAQVEIERLKAQVSFEEGRVSELGLPKLQKQLDTQLSKLQSAYNKFNSIQIQIEPENAKITGFQQDIQNLRNSNNEYRSLLNAQNLKLVQADSDIQKLQIALKNAKSKRQSILSNIKKLQTAIAEAEKKVNANYLEIQKIEIKINVLQEESDKAQIQSKTLEITVDRIQKDLINSQQKEDKIKNRMQALNEQIRLQSLKLANNELTRLKDMVASLQKSIPSVKQQIDNNHYQCQKLQLQSQKNQNNVLVYLVGQKDYTNYIKQVYGNVSIQQNQIKTSLELTTISILSPIWKSTYGNPFSSAQMINRNQFSFGGDFNCLEPSQILPGSGVIRDIKEREIYVEVTTQTGRTQFQLNLGACTRLETTSSVPKIGQSIYWKGSSQQQKKINIYQATCI